MALKVSILDLLETKSLLQQFFFFFKKKKLRNPYSDSSNLEIR